MVFEITVWVMSWAGSWTLRNETPLSHPSRNTAPDVGCSQKPSPYRQWGSSSSVEWGCVIWATISVGTIAPAYSADQNAAMSATVV